MKKNRYILSLLLVLALLLPLPAAAQESPELSLRLSKEFGYSSGFGKMQGTFSLRASGPENLARVVFYMDGQVMGEDSEAPFRLQFNTGSYPTGLHTMQAVGYTGDGLELSSNEVRGEFLTASEAGQATSRIVIPLLVVVFGAILLSALVPIVLSRGKKKEIPLGAPRNYGLAGGAICPKCGRPFGMHIWGFNLLAGKLDRCPHCGRWSLVRRASPSALRQAELAELEWVQASERAPEPTEEEKLRKALENSRYTDV